MNTTKITAAIRIGCDAANVHLACSYPECACKTVPAAVKAAVTFAIRDAARVIRHA
jgi:hypothetical protein